jgi:DNA topoisomerase-2
VPARGFSCCSDEAEVTRYNGSDFTCITFSPDLARFKMDELDDDTVALLSKRVFDMAGCASGFAGPRLKVTLNNMRLPVKSFQEVSVP